MSVDTTGDGIGNNDYRIEHQLKLDSTETLDRIRAIKQYQS